MLCFGCWAHAVRVCLAYVELVNQPVVAVTRKAVAAATEACYLSLLQAQMTEQKKSNQPQMLRKKIGQDKCVGDSAQTCHGQRSFHDIHQ